MSRAKIEPASALSLAVTPRGHFRLEEGGDLLELPAASARRIRGSFSRGTGAGLLSLAGRELASELDTSLGFGRRLARAYLEVLCALREDAKNARVPAREDALDALLAEEDASPEAEGFPDPIEGANRKLLRFNQFAHKTRAIVHATTVFVSAMIVFFKQEFIA